VYIHKKPFQFQFEGSDNDTHRNLAKSGNWQDELDGVSGMQIRWILNLKFDALFASNDASQNGRIDTGLFQDKLYGI